MPSSNNLDRFLSENNENFRDTPLQLTLQRLYTTTGLSKAALAKQSGISEVYLHQLFSGCRFPSRNRLLCVCFGLGASVITDPEKQSWMGAGSEGSFGWPGAFGTWWQADPVEDMVMIYLIQNSIPLEPEAASQLATGQRMGGRAALPVFQKLTYAALGKPL